MKDIMKDSSMNDAARSRRRRSPLVAGILMILVGAMLLCVNLGYGVPWQVLQYYSVALVVLGLVGVVAPSRHLSRSGGIWLLAAGFYCAISQFRMFDLGWSTAWPIFIIAYGVEVVFGTRGRDRAERGKHEA